MRRGGGVAVGLLGHAAERGGEERGGGVGGDVEDAGVLAGAGDEVGRDRLGAFGDRPGEAPGVPVAAQLRRPCRPRGRRRSRPRTSRPDRSRPIGPRAPAACRVGRAAGRRLSPRAAARRPWLAMVADQPPGREGFQRGACGRTKSARVRDEAVSFRACPVRLSVPPTPMSSHFSADSAENCERIEGHAEDGARERHSLRLR
jgi:hypothetical protein